MLDTLPVTRTTSANGPAPRASKAVASDFFAQMVSESAARHGNDDGSKKADNRGAAASRTDDRPVAERERSARTERTDRSEKAEKPETKDPLEAKPVEEADSRSEADAPADQDAKSAEAHEGEAQTQETASSGTTDTTDDQQAAASTDSSAASEDGTSVENPAAGTAAASVVPPLAGQQTADQTSGQAAAQNKASADPGAAASARTAPQQAQALAAATSQQQQAPQAAKPTSTAAGTPANGDFAWNADLPDSALVQRLMQSQQKQGLTIPTANGDLELSLSAEKAGQMVMPQNKLGNDSTLWALAQSSDQSGAGNFSQLLSAGAATATADGGTLPGQLAQVTEQTLAAVSPGVGKASEATSSIQAALPGDITAPRGIDAATPAAAKPATTTGQPPADQVAVQITKAVNGGKDKISLQLNPAELGRVDVKLDVGTDGSVKAVISVDRPETMDLMQRDSRMLEKALQEAGLKTDSGSLSFNLKGEGQNGQGQETAENSNGSLSGSDDADDLTDLDGQSAPPADPSDWHEGVVSIAV